MTKCKAKRLTWFGEPCGEEIWRDGNGEWHHYNEDKQTHDHVAEPENSWGKLPQEVKDKIEKECFESE